MENDDLRHAIATAKAGNRQAAQAILARVVQATPGSEQGWLWLGHCLNEPQKRLFCYQKVLDINPQNEAARQALQALSPNAPPAQQDAQTYQTPVPPTSARPSAAEPKGKSSSSGGIRYWLSLLVPVLFVFLCVLPLMYLFMSGEIQSLAARLLPSPSPSTTRTPAATTTPSPSSTYTRVQDTPTASPSPTLTPKRFKPGDPTATPLGSDITDPNFRAGVTAYDAGTYEEVIGLMGAVIATHPDLAPPYRYRGMAYWYLHDCVSGLADQEKALSLDPEYAVAWADRGLMKICLGDNAQGLEDYQKALSLDPSLAFVHNNLGVYYFALGDYETSLEEYSLGVAVDPTRATAWDGMSEALGRMGRYAECIGKATKAMEIKPDLWLAYSDRGFCYLSMEQNKAAAADYKVFVTQVPDDASAWYNYGIALRHGGDPEGAVAAYTKALELNPSYIEAHINRGNAYNDLEQYTKALSDFNTALESGDIPAAYVGRGYVYYGLKQYDRAMADFKRSIQLFPSSACSYCGLALTYFELGRYQDSLDAAETSNQLDPTCGGQRLLEIQARSYYALKVYDQALLYIDKALDMGVYSRGYYYRGIIFQAAGRNDEAIRDLEQFLSYVQSNGYAGVEVADARARLAKLKP